MTSPQSTWSVVLDGLEAEVERLLAIAHGDIERVLDPPPPLADVGPCPPELLVRAADVLARLQGAESMLAAARDRVRPDPQYVTPRFVDTRV